MWKSISRRELYLAINSAVKTLIRDQNNGNNWSLWIQHITHSMVYHNRLKSISSLLARDSRDFLALVGNQSTRETVYSRMPSDWLPNHIKAAKPLFDISGLAGHFPNRARISRAVICLEAISVPDQRVEASLVAIS